MEGYCSTGQRPHWAVMSVEEEEVHLVGFIIRKFVTMHGHMNVKFVLASFRISKNLRSYGDQEAPLFYVIRLHKFL
jgi:hypothetical protein